MQKTEKEFFERLALDLVHPLFRQVFLDELLRQQRQRLLQGVVQVQARRQAVNEFFWSPRRP